MVHDVFVSYSSADKPIADALCAALERDSIRVWIAPRDILAGQIWGEAIIDAIAGSRVMVVIFSSNSNNSNQVLREVERAVSKGIAIIPFRIEDVVLSKSLEYFLSSPHWLDALTPPLEQHIQRLTEMVRLLMESQFALERTPDSGNEANPDAAEITARKVRPFEHAFVDSSSRNKKDVHVRTTRPNEVVISAPYDAAFEHVTKAMDKLGTVKSRDTEQQVIEGRIKHGLQSVRIRVSLVQRGQGETTAVIQASSDDIWGAGAKNATNRLVETLLNLDNPGYQPDRLGIHPAAFVGALIGFAIIFTIIMVLIMSYVWPLLVGALGRGD